MNDRPLFDFSASSDSDLREALATIAAEHVSLADRMMIVAAFIDRRAYAPLIDWSDRYGWVELPPALIFELLVLLANALGSEFDRRRALIGGGQDG